MNLERLKIKYRVSDLFSFDESRASYSSSLVFDSDYLLINTERVKIEDVKYFLFDKTSYLKLNKAELRGENYDFFIKVIYADNKEIEIQIFSTDDWVVIQELLRQKEIALHTPNSLKVKNQ